MADEIRINASCGKCGEPLTFEEGIPDDAIITCKRCGTEIATFAQIRAAAFERAKAEIDKVVDDSIKDVPWIQRKDKL